MPPPREAAVFYLRYTLLIGLVALLDSAVMPRVAIAGIRPDLGLALVAYAGLFGGPRAGLLLGFLMGAVRGGLDPQWFGLEALLLSLVGFTAGFTSPKVNRAHLVVQGVLLGGLLLAHDLVRALVVSAPRFEHALGLWASVSLATALYTAAVVPIGQTVLARVLRGGDGARS
jgi:rod shape-determining protein MreD